MLVKLFYSIIIHVTSTYFFKSVVPSQLIFSTVYCFSIFNKYFKIMNCSFIITVSGSVNFICDSDKVQLYYRYNRGGKRQ